MVNVYKNGAKEEIVGRVQYNSNLDYWDGSNKTNGGTGMHKGITRLKRIIDGKSFVIIYGSQWQGDRDYAVLVDDKTAKFEIMKADKDELLEKYFGKEALEPLAEI